MQDPSPEAIHCNTSQARTTAVNLFAILAIHLNRIAVLVLEKTLTAICLVTLVAPLTTIYSAE